MILVLWAVGVSPQEELSIGLVLHILNLPSKAVLLVDLSLLFVFIFAILSCLFITAMWSPVGKGLTSWLSCVWSFLCFCHFPIFCPGSGMVQNVLDCINSWSLPSSLLCTVYRLEIVKLTLHNLLFILWFNWPYIITVGKIPGWGMADNFSAIIGSLYHRIIPKLLRHFTKTKGNKKIFSSLKHL